MKNLQNDLTPNQNIVDETAVLLEPQISDLGMMNNFIFKNA